MWQLCLYTYLAPFQAFDAQCVSKVWPLLGFGAHQMVCTAAASPWCCHLLVLHPPFANHQALVSNSSMARSASLSYVARLEAKSGPVLQANLAVGPRPPLRHTANTDSTTLSAAEPPHSLLHATATAGPTGVQHHNCAPLTGEAPHTTPAPRPPKGHRR